MLTRACGALMIRRALNTTVLDSGKLHNQICLQLAAMEGGEDATVFATGVAALHAVFFTFLKSGDHLIVGDGTYEAVWRLFSDATALQHRNHLRRHGT